MIAFWILAIAMVVIALFFLLRPLGLDLDSNDADRTEQNIGIAKERLSELKLELEQGVISQAEYDQTRQELEQSLLNDIEQEPVENSSKKINSENNRIIRFVLMFSVPVLAASFYAYLGNPELIDDAKQRAAAPSGHASSQDSELGTVEQMVEKLAARMKEKPDNAEGWFMLGRTYMSLNRYEEAVAALEKTNELVPNNPAVMLRYADALTMLRGGQMSGKPFELIKKAVAMKPDDPTGLWLLGMGYEEQGEYQKAISYWNLLLPLLKDDKSVNEVTRLIQQTKRKSGNALADTTPVNVKPIEKTAVKKLTVKVSIDKSMLKNVSENDIVFIFARALNGPPMPLAAVRKQVKDLPVEVILDDSMAMMPNMKMSSFEKVHVVARVSKSGSAMPQSGDLESEAHEARAGQKEKIELTINRSIP
ncbi:MAG: c-type cytochrome biogenesis protein CcmI [Gammaproteobacteria bacterium]|nr:c-type cytochrome biogenesis protein CcmI [Gammaproteobacteria bacterium]